MSPDELRLRIDAAAPRAGKESQRLTRLIVQACWPGGPEDHTERAVLDGRRRWQPEEIPAALPTCSCATGRCVVCN